MLAGSSVTAPIRAAIRVEGIVQGVGFRPFVYTLATGLGLSGFVGNDVDGVFAEVEGEPAAVREFLRAVERDAPPLARVYTNGRKPTPWTIPSTRIAVRISAVTGASPPAR